jgi:hypothetical protein
VEIDLVEHAPQGTRVRSAGGSRAELSESIPVGFFDDILDSLVPGFGGDGRGDRKLQRLIDEGERCTARVEGLHIAAKADAGDEWTWRLRVRTSAGELVTGVRQQLIPHPEHVTLGSELDVIHRDGQVAIDWPATLLRLTGAPGPGAAVTAVKTRTDPPAEGIVDERLDRKRLERGRRTTGRVLATEAVAVMGVPTQNQHITLALADGQEVVVKRALVPAYAAHLLAIGAELPVAVDAKHAEKVSIDWPAAAMAATAT